MNVRTLSIIASMAAWAPLAAQISTGGVPYSFRAGTGMDGIPTVQAAPFDAVAVAAADAARQAEGKLPAYARVQAVDAGLEDAGRWLELANGDRLWQLRVTSTGALATELYFGTFHMPDNAVLYVYGDDGGSVLGGFTSFNNRDDGTFATSLVPGESCILEYYEPAAVAGEGRLRISGLGHAYRDVDEVTASGACEVDVNCSEGNNWHPQRDAVVRISILSQGQSFWCSGSLVNNLQQNCKPYFLTALHCAEGSSVSDMNQWKFYFNYERSGCGSGTSPSNRTVLGCTRRGSSNDGGGNSGSDFLLVEANNPTIPTAYQPYWAGWDATGTGSTGGVGIHHPAGDRKKISTYTGNTVNSTWGGVNGTHWRVSWAATANGHGVTEGGSSGSPLFNAGKRIIGTLTGGGSCCVAGDCGPGTSPSAFDYYGKVSYHWQSNPGTATMRLKKFLDPQSTGTLTMDGSYNPCGPASVGDVDGAVERLALYPNPAGELAVVVLPENLGRGGMLEVRDMSGRLLAGHLLPATGEFRLNTAPLAGGTYLLRVLDGPRLLATAPLIVVHP